MTGVDWIRHPLIERVGVAHGFGTRASAVPPNALRPVQIHGAGVLYVGSRADVSRDIKPPARDVVGEADAIVCRLPGQVIAIVTADCIPILACSQSGNAVAAIHAGWRGLAGGVIEAGIEALREFSSPGENICAAIGPHIEGCCYEVDEPVLGAMARRFGAQAVDRASEVTRPGHARLSMAELAELALGRVGVAPEFRGRLEQSCTSCGVERFHSFRREGAGAGRMAHFIVSH